MSEKKNNFWRPLTSAEKKINFSDIKMKMDDSEGELKKQLKVLLERIQNDLEGQLKKILNVSDGKKRIKMIGDLEVSLTGDYKKLLQKHFERLFESSKTTTAHEMKKTPPTTQQKDKILITQRVEALAEVMEGDLLKTLKLSLIDALEKQMGENEKFVFFDKDWIMEVISLALGKKITDITNSVPALLVGGAVNEGRRAAFESYSKDIYALQRSEVLDNQTCNYCLSVDSKVFDKKDIFVRNNLFHFNCRGIWVEIMKDEEEKPSIAGIPDSLRERFEGIGNLNSPDKPIFIKKDSPAAELLKKS